MIVPTITQVNDDFLQKKFANKHLGDQRTLRIGNIVSFISPVFIKDGIPNKSYEADEAINFAIEIPEISNYAGVCFQRLFVTNVANILAVKFCKDPIEIINNDIIIKKEHSQGGIHQVDGMVSLNVIRQISGAITIYLGLYNKAGEKAIPRAYSLNFDMDTCKKLMDSVNENFYHLANGVFLSTAKM
jgi:hypothetical protein